MHFEAFKAINYRLWLALILTQFIPLIYATTRVHFLGALPSASAFTIAAQVTWLNVGYEVLKEALLVPLAFILGSVIKHTEEFRARAGVALLVTLMSYAGLTFIVLVFAPEFVQAVKQQEGLWLQTAQYIRLESIAILLSSVYAFVSLVLLLKNRQRHLYWFLITQSLLTILCDSFLVSQHAYSLQLGVMGIAVSNLVVNGVLALIALVYLSRCGIVLQRSYSGWISHNWLREWWLIGWKSGLESFVRNAAFVIMILQLINEVRQAGNFWVANQFIWGWLLLPVLALGQLIKRDTATSNGLTEERLRSYLWLSLGIVLIWLVSASTWEGFISNVMGVQPSLPVTNVVWLMVGFYAIFTLNNVVDSYFYGLGRTDLMLYQSLIVNILFYGSAFILYQFGVFVPTLERITLMFGIGMTIDALITWTLYLGLRRKTLLQTI
ncbi:multidrug transporter [Pseudidiomarina sediminum]|uniref:Multidrug transporter n=1 Tax=Pseudidiomarina sediminum TaxID=431675 RepID=A0A432Z3U2_9GAMM|nr:multidrug transporter [Pseudidiomarina sediminum]